MVGRSAVTYLRRPSTRDTSGPPQGARGRAQPPLKTARARTDLSLRFYDRVLGLGHLHYGLWADGDPRNLEGLRAAQERYADHLVATIPRGARRILDAGCGTGGLALKLKQSGFEVTGVSPDPYQRDRFTERTDLPFIVSRFQDLREWPATDLILMAESSQYIPVEAGFEKAREILKPGGWILAADYFTRLKDGTRLTKSGHLEEAYRAAGLSHGFELKREENLTDRVLPTLELVHGWVRTFAEPTFELLTEAFQTRYPKLARMVLRVLNSRIADARRQVELIDPAVFRRVKSYRLFLWQRGR